MEVYAAQGDNLDQNIGRVVAQLKDLGKRHNTIIFFISHNGATGDDATSGLINQPTRNWGRSVRPVLMILTGRAPPA